MMSNGEGDNMEALWPLSAFVMLYIAYQYGGRPLLIAVALIGIYMFKVMSD